MDQSSNQSNKIQKQQYLRIYKVLQILNNQLKQIDHGDLKFEAFQKKLKNIQQSQQATVKQFCENLIDIYNLSQNSRARLWRLGKDFPIKKVFDHIKEELKPVSYLNECKIKFIGKRIEDQDSKLVDLNIQEEEYFVFEHKMYTRDWYFQADNQECACKKVAYCTQNCKEKDKRYHLARCSYSQKEQLKNNNNQITLNLKNKIKQQKISQNLFQDFLSQQNQNLKEQIDKIKKEHQKMQNIMKIQTRKKVLLEEEIKKFRQEVDLLKSQLSISYNQIQQWKSKYLALEFNFKKFEKEKQNAESNFNECLHNKQKTTFNQELLLKLKKDNIQIFKKEKNMTQQSLKLIKAKIYEIFKKQNSQQNLLGECFSDLFELIHQLIQEAEYYKKKKIELSLTLRQKEYCKNCMEKEANMLYDSCGHVAVCQKCSLDIKKFGCIICKNQQGKYIKSFRS